MWRIAAEGLRRTSQGFLPKTVGFAATSALDSKAKAHPIFDLPWTARSLKSAKLVGWRFLVPEGRQSAIGVEVHCSKTGKATGFSHVTRGPHARDPHRVLLQPGNRPPETRKGRFTLRLLRTPELSLTAMWFHSERNDIFRPLAPVPAPFREGKTYSAEDFIRLFLECASSRREHFSKGDPTLPRGQQATSARREAAHPTGASPASPDPTPTGPKSPR